MSETTVVMNTAASEAVSDGPRVGDFVALLKPRVMSLVVFTALAGLVLAPGALHPVLAVMAILCIAVGAGASGAINMWYDADIDAEMFRTRRRPIPMGRVAPGEALGFGATLAAGSVMVMGLATNWVAAALLALTIAFYVFVYTMWLKRRTPQNIVIGGATGALPPMIAWAAVSGDVSLGGLALFAIVFMWTPPHFWSLALFRSDDYARVGVPMLPVAAGKRETRRQIVIYSVLLFPVTLLPWYLGLAGALYGIAASVLGALFLVAAILVLLGLAGWQLQRLAWKQGLIDTVEAQLAAAPVALPAEAEVPKDWLYRRVTLSGRFHHDREIHLLAQTKRGNLGYQIITPLERPDGSFVLVDRGWVPTGNKDPVSRARGQVVGLVQIEGIVRLPWKQGLFVPDNDPAANIWFYGDLAAMTEVADVSAPGFMVEAGSAPNPGGLPIGGQTRVTFRNDHLQYALTWFALAVALAVIFFLFGRRRANTES